MKENKLMKALKNTVKWPFEKRRRWIGLFVFVWVLLTAVPIILGELHRKIPDAIDMTARTDGYTISYDVGIASAVKMLMESEYSFYGWVLLSILSLGLFALMATPLASRYFDHLDAQRGHDIKELEVQKQEPSTTPIEATQEDTHGDENV